MECFQLLWNFLPFKFALRWSNWTNWHCCMVFHAINFDERISVSGVWERLVCFFRKRQTTSTFRLYRSIKVAIEWQFPVTLSKKSVRLKKILLDETKIAEIERIFSKKTSRLLMKTSNSTMHVITLFAYKLTVLSTKTQSSRSLQVLKLRLKHWLKKRCWQFWRKLGLSCGKDDSCNFFWLILPLEVPMLETVSKILLHKDNF